MADEFCNVKITQKEFYFIFEDFDLYFRSPVYYINVQVWLWPKIKPQRKGRLQTP